MPFQALDRSRHRLLLTVVLTKKQRIFMKVKGIKQGEFNKIRDLITVE